MATVDSPATASSPDSKADTSRQLCCAVSQEKKREQRKGEIEKCDRWYEKAAAFEAMVMVDSPATASSPDSQAAASHLQLAGRAGRHLKRNRGNKTAPPSTSSSLQLLSPSSTPTASSLDPPPPPPMPLTFIPTWLCAVREGLPGLRGIVGGEDGLDGVILQALDLIQWLVSNCSTYNLFSYIYIYTHAQEQII